MSQRDTEGTTTNIKPQHLHQHNCWQSFSSILKKHLVPKEPLGHYLVVALNGGY